MSAITAVVEQAQTSARKLTTPLVVSMSNTVTNLADTVSNPQSLMTSFDSLLSKVGILVKIGDEVAKVRPLLFEIIALS